MDNIKWKLKLFSYKSAKVLRRIGLTPKRFLLLLIAVCVLIYYMCLRGRYVCSNYEAQSYINALCLNYREGRVIGDFCPEICDNLQTTFRLKSCQKRHYGKDVVFSAFWKDNEIFVKGVGVDTDHPDLHPIYKIDSKTGQKIYPESLADFEMTAEHFLNDNMGVLHSGNIFRTFLNMDAPDEDEPKILEVAMDNLWSLVQSNEFVFSQIFEQFDIFPEVYGSCGPIYAVEKLERLPLPQSSAEENNFFHWVKRVDIALKMLDLVEELENVFDQPVHFCDVKSEHFGISNLGRIKVLDVDHVGFQSVIEKTVNNGENCTNHEDCDYFDCKGTCDLIEKKCNGPITNNNLQVICEKIFYSNSYLHYFMGESGLLLSKHMHNRLKEVLRRCSNPSHAKDKTRIAVDEKTRQELYKLLREIKDISKKLSNDT